MKSTQALVAAAALAAGAFGFAGTAQAGGVHWSVGVTVPGVVVGFGSVPPVVYAPPPVYMHPAPVYAPPPVYAAPAAYYMPPPPVIYRPAPIYYYGRPGHYRHPPPRWGHHRR